MFFDEEMKLETISDIFKLIVQKILQMEIQMQIFTTFAHT